jgi:hypothetical protein
MIDANPDLLERDLIKQQQMADEFSRALEQRGVASHLAELAAHVGIQLFRIAYRRWLAANEANVDLTRLVDEVTSTLAELVPSNPSAAAP